MYESLCNFIHTSRHFDLSEIYGQEKNNVLIRGDNLFVLQEIESQITEKIKCIYIDPPYNSCESFLDFNDDMDSNEWESEITPRLQILWKSLRNDGSIWISIDDNECHYLKVLCDKLWGRNCFVTTIVRQKNDAPRDTVRPITHMHDYILVYAKNPEKVEFNKLPASYFNEYFNSFSDSKGAWLPENILSKKHSDNNYEIQTPDGCIIKPPQGRSWLIPESEFIVLKNNNEIWYGEKNNEIPVRKRYFSGDAFYNPTTLWNKNIVGDNQEARREINIFNHSEFFYVPKPERMIATILRIASSPGDLVLDAYLGSGTTAAVAHKMQRKWIGIELGSQCDSYCLPRLKAVVDGEQGGISYSVNWKGGGGFQYFKLNKGKNLI